MQLETQALGDTGLQTPLAPWILSLAPSLGALCSMQ
uniref:Uncharacterized protein n=1 Tax=Trichinella nativa TaxID=6335 RepID=A0A0V1JKW6_9BILA